MSTQPTVPTPVANEFRKVGQQIAKVWDVLTAADTATRTYVDQQIAKIPVSSTGTGSTGTTGGPLVTVLDTFDGTMANPAWSLYSPDAMSVNAGSAVIANGKWVWRTLPAGSWTAGAQLTVELLDVTGAFKMRVDQSDAAGAVIGSWNETTTSPLTFTVDPNAKSLLLTVDGVSGPLTIGEIRLSDAGQTASSTGGTGSGMTRSEANF